jgi:hypothetical protein
MREDALHAGFINLVVSHSKDNLSPINALRWATPRARSARQGTGGNFSDMDCSASVEWDLSR